MIEFFYRVVYEGDLMPGFQQADVQKKLAHLFAIDDARAARFFTGKPRTIKSRLELKQAKKYARALAKLGAMGYIVQEVVETVEAPPVEPQPVREDLTVTGSFDVSAVRKHFEDLEKRKAENDKSARHEIFSFDTFDKEVAELEKDDVELSGVQNVLTAEQIKQMLHSGKK